MKTIVIIALVALFILTIFHFFSKTQCEGAECEEKDKRAEGIRRAKKNLHPKYNKNVDRDATGRFIKRS